MKTDGSPSESHWALRDDQGVIVASHNTFTSANAIYTDTVYLPNGCYNFKMTETGVNSGDGICCFNGSGFLRIFMGASSNPIINVGDFGEYYALNFTIDFIDNIDENTTINDVFIYPNPATRSVTLNTSFEYAKIEVDILDLTGRIVSPSTNYEVSGYSTQFNLPELSDGIYYLRIRKNADVFMEKVYIIKN